MRAEHDQQSRPHLQRPGQDGRGGGDICADAARIREGVEARAHIDTERGQQSRPPLRRPGQDGRGEGDAAAGAARTREGVGP
jgi:hypothetical protein